MHQQSVSLRVERIELFERTVRSQLLRRFQIGGNHVGSAVNPTQIGYQFGTELTSCTYNKYLFHKKRLQIDRKGSVFY